MMGWNVSGRTYATITGALQAERRQAAVENRSREAEKEEKLRRIEAKRMAVADKIVLALVDEISAAIVRPGPKPEERECYVMAQELRDHSPELRSIVVSILQIDEAEKTS